MKLTDRLLYCRAEIASAMLLLDRAKESDWPVHPAVEILTAEAQKALQRALTLSASGKPN